MKHLWCKPVGRVWSAEEQVVHVETTDAFFCSLSFCFLSLILFLFTLYFRLFFLLCHLFHSLVGPVFIFYSSVLFLISFSFPMFLIFFSYHFLSLCHTVLVIIGSFFHSFLNHFQGLSFSFISSSFFPPFALILSIISAQVFLLVICNLSLLCLAHLFAFSVLSLLWNLSIVLFSWAAFKTNTPCITICILTILWKQGTRRVRDEADWGMRAMVLRPFWIVLKWHTSFNGWE